MNSSKWIDERSHNDINQGGHNMVGARKSCRSKKLGLNVCLMLCGGLLLLGGGKTAWGMIMYVRTLIFGRLLWNASP